MRRKLVVGGGGWESVWLTYSCVFGKIKCRMPVLCRRPFLLLLSSVVVIRRVVAVIPRISNESTTTHGDFISSTAWHPRTRTNISWSVPASEAHRLHLIVVFWDELATATWRFGDTNDNTTRRANTPPPTTSSWTSYYVPPLSRDKYLPESCAIRYEVYTPSPRDTFYTEMDRGLVTSNLTEASTWWYTATLGQEEPRRTSDSSTVGNTSVLLSEPGLYFACLLLGNHTCHQEECINFTVYQPPYDFIEVESTNIGAPIMVRFNLVTRYAYPGDWAWILGGVNPAFSVDEANALDPIDVASSFEERCWFYFGRAVELNDTFLCSPDPDPTLAALQSTSTVRAYQYGRFQMYASTSGIGSIWFAKHEFYTYALIESFYTCGISVQPLESQTVNTTSDLTVTAVPEFGETCKVDDGIALRIRTGEMISPNVPHVDAWTYFTGRVVNLTSDATKLSLRLPYQGEHSIMVLLMSGAVLDALYVTAVASDPYAPLCQVLTRPPGSLPSGSSIYLSLTARDFYANNVTRRWGDDAFNAWTLNSAANKSVAKVSDDSRGFYSVSSDVQNVTGVTFLFLERNGLSVPGSPFEVYVFGPSTCQVVSMVGGCESTLSRKVAQEWAVNSACIGYFDALKKDDVACGFVPVLSNLGKIMITGSALAAMYAALILMWIRQHRRSVIVRLSQPFVCQLFLLGCILLNLTAMLYVGRPTDISCVARPWLLHVALTFSSSCLYLKTYRVHRIFNSSKLSRISITDRQLVYWVLQLVAVDILVLTIWTVVDGPRKEDRNEVIGGTLVVNPVCTGGSRISFSVVLWVWKTCLNVFGVVMGAKTWHCEDGVGESQLICLSVYNTTLLGLVNLAVRVLLVDKTGLALGVCTLTAVTGSAFTMSVLFGPKVYRLSVYGDLPTNATERRSSITLTNKTMGTLSLERRRSSMKSSLTGSALGSKFLQIESRIQPDENPTLEAAVSSSLNRESFLKAPRQEDRGEEDRKGPS